jgi:hypothetical protein
MRQAFLLLVTAAALPAQANPIIAEFLTAKHRAGCEVEVTVRRIKGMKPGLVRKARIASGFESPACRADVKTLAQTPRAKLPGYGEGSVGAQHYDVTTFKDTVCADGAWFYRLVDPARDGPEWQEYAPKAEVNVKGCAAKAAACPKPFDAVATVQFVDPPKAPCEETLGWGYMEVGGSRDLENNEVGALIRGEGVVEISGKTVRALAPGLAWYRLGGPEGGPNACVTFTVMPRDRIAGELDAIRRWAFRHFLPAGKEEDKVVVLKEGEKWTIPLAGKLEVDPLDAMVKPDVDAQCRPALRATRMGNDRYYTGVQLTEPNGTVHRYLINETGEQLGVACNVRQRVTLPLDRTEKLALPPLLVGGDDVVDRVQGKIRAARVGEGYYADSATSPYCFKVTVEGPPGGNERKQLAGSRDEQIADVRKRLTDPPAGPPTVIELKVGEARLVDITMERISGTNAGVVELGFEKKALRLTGVEPGYEGFVIDDGKGRRVFFFVEVK